MKWHVTVTNGGFLRELMARTLDPEEQWTVNRHVRTGDRVLLYVVSPVSAIVAAATVAGDPWLDEEPDSPFLGSYWATLVSLERLERRIEREDLRREFPEWGYWRQPRQSIVVPESYRPVLAALVTARTSNTQRSTYS